MMLINSTHLLDAVYSSQQGDATIAKLFPHIHHKLSTFRQDKNCSCKESILEAFEDRPDLAEKLASAFWNEVKFIPMEKRKPERNEKPHSRVIDASPEAFDELIATIPKDTYSGVLVVPNADLVTWTVLFY